MPEAGTPGLDTDMIRRLVFVWSMVLVLQEKYMIRGENLLEDLLPRGSLLISSLGPNGG